MKKISVLIIVICMLISGCATSQNDVSDGSAVVENTAIGEAANNDSPEIEQTTDAKTIHPLPDNTMENISDAILSVSLEEGDVYVDASGIMQMDLKIYTFDKYDMVDIASLELGDLIVTQSGEVKVTSKEQSESGTVHINGGLEAGGFDLATNDGGIFYETGFNDVKNWYEIGETSLRVSGDFVFRDTSDLEKGETLYYPGSFLVGEVTNYNFTPYNTTVRVENGLLVEMHRVYTP